MSETVFQSCTKCDGKGYLNAFRNVHNGQCFGCSGQGGWKVSAETKRKREANRKRREAAQKRKREDQLKDLERREEQALDQLEALGADDIGMEAYRGTGLRANVAQTALHSVRDGGMSAREAYDYYVSARDQ